MSPRPKSWNERGLVFVTMVAFVFLGLLSMMAIQRKLQTYINVLQAELRESSTEDGKRLAMAKGLSLLQTGLPPMSPSAYNVQLEELEDHPIYTVVYEEFQGTPVCGGVEPSWKVTVKAMDGTNPALPEKF